MQRSRWVVITVAASAAAALLFGGGGVAWADYPNTEGSGGVDVSVEIAPPADQGALTLSIAGASTTLEENGSDDSIRQFTGTLPEVTVRDTRTNVPEGVGWYVLGQASDFVGDAGQDAISAGHLGWAPDLVDAEGQAEVAVGNQVDTVLDGGPNGVGLVGEELLALALDSAEAQATEGEWTATAELFLKTAPDVAPGSYTSLLTISLFEDEY